MATVIPPNLPTLVRSCFFAAKAAGELTFYPTSVVVVHVHSNLFQLRFSPALASKPKSNSASKPKAAATSPATSPFLNPPPALLICALPPSHVLVLNKFAIVPAHFILATREYKTQTGLLDETDLAAAWECLKAWKTGACGEEGEGELFAFFNSGEHSGASQAHRHLQLLPVEMMREGLQKEGQGQEWGVLADRLVGDGTPDLPFRYFATALPPDLTTGQLHRIYIELYERACGLVRGYVARHPEEDGRPLSDNQNGEAVISYNLSLTEKAMVLCPRRAEGSLISDSATGVAKIGPVSLNGTVLAGTLLVKNEAEWNALRSDVSQLSKVLEAIGIPSPSIVNEKL